MNGRERILFIFGLSLISMCAAASLKSKIEDNDLPQRVCQADHECYSDENCVGGECLGDEAQFMLNLKGRSSGSRSSSSRSYSYSSGYSSGYGYGYGYNSGYGYNNGGSVPWYIGIPIFLCICCIVIFGKRDGVTTTTTTIIEENDSFSPRGTPNIDNVAQGAFVQQTLGQPLMPGQ
jgi:hypothetical protein